MLRVEQLCKSFAGTTVVKKLSFEIGAGESFGLLGPNGAGKTTTIKMLVGALAPDSGSITLHGQSMHESPEIRRKLGVAPQSLSLYENLTGRENLVFFAKLYGLKGQELKTRVDWALDLADLVSRQKDLVATYSGGMQRRLNFACAVVHNPDLILLDEPTVGVDPQSRDHLFRSIEKAKSEGKTILYTTHYMEEAERLCDRIAIMDEGSILAVDTVANLIAKHGGAATITGELEEELKAQLQNDALVWDDCQFRLTSHEPVKAIAELAGSGLPFKALNIKQANLESVFFSLTGRTLRDA
ncbi:MAG: ABC transporter ATP-binding protein [Planctomycetota bacterium]|nr:ABC transporter ATP-binding protein [Planctomycetota bacterium]